jgi:hypothetical protein
MADPISVSDVSDALSLDDVVNGKQYFCVLDIRDVLSYDDIVNGDQNILIDTIIDALTYTDVAQGKQPLRSNVITDTLSLSDAANDICIIRLPLVGSSFASIFNDSVYKESLRRMSSYQQSENKENVKVGWGNFVDQSSTDTYVDIGSLCVSFFRTKTFVFTATLNDLLVNVLGSIDGGLTYDITLESDINITVGTPLTKTYATPLTHIKIQVKSATAGSVGTLATKHFQTWAELYVM